MKVFKTNDEAVLYAKENPGVVITRAQDGQGYIVKEPRSKSECDSVLTDTYVQSSVSYLKNKMKNILNKGESDNSRSLLISTKKELNYIHVDENYIVATDTRIMIKIENSGSNMESGFLDKKTQNYIEDMNIYKYPDYLRIFPKNNLMYKAFNIQDHSIESTDDGEFYYNIDGALISKMYVDKLLAYDYRFDYCTQGDNAPVSFRSLGETVHVVIMPFKL